VGRKSNFVKLIAALSIFASVNALAQGQPQRPNARGGGPAPGSGTGPVRQAPVNNMREHWLSLPSSDQQIFRRNAERWMQMSPAERMVLRERENLRRQQIKHETEEALRNSGLRLDQQKRDLFESRYMQERRKMEQMLRQQIETERQQQLPALIQQLKKEFQLDQPNGSATAKPTMSPKSVR
jgi:hypothetical protein